MTKNMICKGKLLILLFLTGATIHSCKTDDQVNPQEWLQKNWSLNSSTGSYLTKDGVDITSKYPGLTITFKADGTYTSTNGGKLIFPSGKWAWTGDDTKQFVLNESASAIPITVIELTPEVLEIQFMMQVEDVNTNGKVDAVVGNYKAKLTAN